MSIPKDVVFKAGDIEVVRVLGKIDLVHDARLLEVMKRELERSDPEGYKAFNSWQPRGGDSSTSGRETSVRVFEARIPGGTRCFLKEYLPIGLTFGKRELSTTRKLSARWNEMYSSNNNNTSLVGAGSSSSSSSSSSSKGNSGSRSSSSSLLEDRELRSVGGKTKEAPFPILLGSLRTDERIENFEFRAKWSQRFPRTRPPAAGNLWLIFKWDEASFKSLRAYPALPQVVTGLDYFRKSARDEKRWRFVRKLMRRGLECIDFLHRTGYCHNAVSTESMWMSSTDQLQIESLDVKITDLGACQKLTELGPYAREGVVEDLYQLGLIFLELVLASFSEDATGAQRVRLELAGEKQPQLSFFERIAEVQTPQAKAQLSQRELAQVFEELCDSDFQSLRTLVSSTPGWKDASQMLEEDEGAAWKLIFRLLARGRLASEISGKPLKITGASLVRDNGILFDDTY